MPSLEKWARFHSFRCALIFFFFCSLTAVPNLQTLATDRFVVAGNSQAVAPYTNWFTAAAVIQDAVDAAENSDTVWVTNGVYEVGGRPMPGSSLTNRVTIGKAVTVRSVNGPSVTIIRGAKDPVSTNGNAAVRCVAMTNGATLVGFTLTNGATHTSWMDNDGGGIWCASTNAAVSNCVIVGNSAASSGGGSYRSTLNNCTLSGNSASSGGGSYYGMLNNCTLSGNSARDGGGSYEGTLNNCTLTGNSASVEGGGSYAGALIDCMLIGNRATNNISCGYYFVFCLCEGLTYGGGASKSALTRCQVISNTANYAGGGVSGGTLANCTISHNRVTGIPPYSGCEDFWNNSYGGGASGARLYNCLLTQNKAPRYGGGAYGCELYNCTVYSNAAQLGGGGTGSCPTQENTIVYGNSLTNGSVNNWSGGSFRYCCTTPLPDGPGNMVSEPVWVNAAGGDFRLSASSPCIDAGFNQPWMPNTLDLGGSPRVICGRVDMGAYEYDGPELRCRFAAGETEAAVPLAVVFTGFVAGVNIGTSVWRWDFNGDGVYELQGAGLSCVTSIFTNIGWHTVVLNVTNSLGESDFFVASNLVYAAPPIVYVATNGTDRFPYTNWLSAARILQTAVDAGRAGTIVWVTNGCYDQGGRAVGGGMLTNRLAVPASMQVRSVNGPGNTIIRGAWDPATTNGVEAVRCAYLGSNVVLSGFTLTNGATRADGDDYRERSGGGVWGEASAVVSNCIVMGNSASYYGGGAYGGTLKNCTLSGNSGVSGGGSAYGTLNICTLSGNWASSGGGSCYGTLNNCTLSGNSASWSGGGSYYGTLNNCIVYYNTAANGANYSASTFNYSCTTPAPSSGTNNITAAPMLLSASHIASNSPCVGAGSSLYATGRDIDGEAWRSPPAMGCDEPWSPATGALTVAISAGATNTVLNYPVRFRADIQGVPAGTLWTFGDGMTVSNQAFDVEHAWASTGLYDVVIWAWNDGNPGGVAATVRVSVASGLHYVVLSNATPVAPYTSWATAAPNIQDAIDTALPGSLVLVSNGVYGFGGRPMPGSSLTNRVTINRAVTARSVNGPSVTIIRGAKDPAGTNGNAAVRCVAMTNGATLVGFTLTNGATHTNSPDLWGGGIWCASTNAVVSNCVIVGNSASYYGGGSAYGTLNNCTLSGNSAGRYGGGSYEGTLNNCTLSGNFAISSGGGSSGGTLNNCTLSGNWASGNSGGGSHYGTLNNCTLSGNSARQMGGGSYEGTLNNCTLSGNSARDGGGSNGGMLNNCTLSINSASTNGGGSSEGTLNNCMLSGNAAGVRGGGSYYGTLNNCTLSGNSASTNGGGSYGGTLNNCIVYYNTAPNSANYTNSTFNYCCTTPAPGGSGSITNDPQFVNAAASNFHLTAASPCIDKGRNSGSSLISVCFLMGRICCGDERHPTV